MRVRMKLSITGTRDGKDWPAKGEEVDLPDTEGADLCAAGIAEPVVVERAEKATAPAAEKRARKK